MAKWSLVDERLWKLRLPRGAPMHPAVAIARRVAIAVAIVLLNWGLVLAERQGYRDGFDGEVSVVDALYYTTVTLSTTGYGDITPVTDRARLTNALLVTPMRFLFVLVLVGTTIQVLTERSRESFKVTRWRSRVKDHVVVCGYGTKGRSAVRSLLQRDPRRDQIVVLDTNPHNVEDANASGLNAIHGSSADDKLLREAVVDRARAVIVAVDRDDTAVLTTLSVRQLAPHVTVVAAIREEQNAKLLRHSGASSIITSSDAAGRLLGLATESPCTVQVIEDLLSYGEGLDIFERDVAATEVGSSPQATGVPVLAVVRAGGLLSYDDERVGVLRNGDRVIFVGRQPRTV